MNNSHSSLRDSAEVKVSDPKLVELICYGCQRLPKTPLECKMCHVIFCREYVQSLTAKG